MPNRSGSILPSPWPPPQALTIYQLLGYIIELLQQNQEDTMAGIDDLNAAIAALAAQETTSQTTITAAFTAFGNALTTGLADLEAEVAALVAQVGTVAPDLAPAVASIQDKTAALVTATTQATDAIAAAQAQVTAADPGPQTPPPAPAP